MGAYGTRAGTSCPPDAPGRIRTCGLSLRRRALYPLSYGRRPRSLVRAGGVPAGIASPPWRPACDIGTKRLTAHRPSG